MKENSRHKRIILGEGYGCWNSDARELSEGFSNAFPSSVKEGISITVLSD